MTRSAARAAVTGLAVGVLCAGLLAACGGGNGGGGGANSSHGSPAGSAAPASAGGASSHYAGVTSLGSESPAARMTALQAVRAPGPVVVPLSSDQSAQVNLWPDACSVLTAAQVKAVIPGNYTPTPVSSYGLQPPNGNGAKPAHPDKCVWQLGGGANGSTVTVTLDDQEPASVQAGGSGGGGPTVDLGNGVTCQDSAGSLSCKHQSWDFSVSGTVVHPDGSSDFSSPALASDWLQPLASAVGSVLQGT